MQTTQEGLQEKWLNSHSVIWATRALDHPRTQSFLFETRMVQSHGFYSKGV